MYTAAFNIIVTYNQEQVVTTSPYLLVNENFSNITMEIRRLIRENFQDFSYSMNVPLNFFRINLSVFDGVNYHVFDINCNKIREMQELLKSIYPKDIYDKLMY